MLWNALVGLSNPQSIEFINRKSLSWAILFNKGLLTTLLNSNNSKPLDFLYEACAIHAELLPWIDEKADTWPKSKNWKGTGNKTINMDLGPRGIAFFILVAKMSDQFLDLKNWPCSISNIWVTCTQNIDFWPYLRLMGLFSRIPDDNPRLNQGFLIRINWNGGASHGLAWSLVRSLLQTHASLFRHACLIL